MNRAIIGGGRLSFRDRSRWEVEISLSVILTSSSSATSVTIALVFSPSVNGIPIISRFSRRPYCSRESSLTASLLVCLLFSAVWFFKVFKFSDLYFSQQFNDFYFLIYLL